MVQIVQLSGKRFSGSSLFQFSFSVKLLSNKDNARAKGLGLYPYSFDRQSSRGGLVDAGGNSLSITITSNFAGAALCQFNFGGSGD